MTNEIQQIYKHDGWFFVSPEGKLHGPYKLEKDCNLAAREYNALREVCDLFDVTVLQDYWAGTDEHPEAGHPLFALGQHGELAAGLRRFEMTPHFETLDKLYSFCYRNLAKFREAAKDEDAVPDATQWI